MSERIKEEYGCGLFALASEEGLDGEILREIRILGELLTWEYLHLLENPDIPKHERVDLVAKLLDGRVHPYLANFVKIMTERGVSTEISESFEVYERLYREKYHIRKVRAVSAVELSAEQKEKLQTKLETNMKCAVEIEYEIERSLLGGMRLYFDDRQIDDSIESKLKEIGTGLSGTVV